MKIKTAVDFDGSLVRTADLVCNLVNYRLGTKYTSKDIVDWHFWEKDRVHEAAFWGAYDLMDRTNLRTILEPYDRMTVKSFARIAYFNNGVDIVTGNKDIAKPSIEAWLRLNIPDWRKLRIKVCCVGRQSAKIKSEQDYKVFIDDAPALAESVRGSGKELYLMNARWNEGVVDGGGVRRFNEWFDVYTDFIERLRVCSE